MARHNVNVGKLELYIKSELMTQKEFCEMIGVVERTITNIRRRWWCWTPTAKKLVKVQEDFIY